MDEEERGPEDQGCGILVILAVVAVGAPVGFAIRALLGLDPFPPESLIAVAVVVVIVVAFVWAEEILNAVVAVIELGARGVAGLFWVAMAALMGVAVVALVVLGLSAVTGWPVDRADDGGASGGASGGPPEPRCAPGYEGVCLDPDARDYDCGGGTGDGPRYVWKVIRVTGSDPFDLDRDGNGWGCE